MKKIKVILIGAGNRGTTYAQHAFDACPELEIVAVADPNPVRRNYIKEKFGLPNPLALRAGRTSSLSTNLPMLRSSQLRIRCISSPL